MITLKDKNILVTGASSGIGRACSILFSKLGATVIMLGRRNEGLKQTLNQMENGKHQIFSHDLEDNDKIEDLVKHSVEKTGKISGFVHSAGLEMTVPLKVMNKAQYEKILVINVIAGFELARIISNTQYVTDEGASFVFISSIMGLLGQPGKIGYCSSKGALIAGAKAMALELASKKIRVNCLLPGIVETEMTQKLFESISPESKKAIIKMHPLGLGKPEDIASMCAFILSDHSKWITGTNIVLDGGYSAQ